MELMGVWEELLLDMRQQSRSSEERCGRAGSFSSVRLYEGGKWWWNELLVFGANFVRRENLLEIFCLAILSTLYSQWNSPRCSYWIFKDLPSVGYE